MKHMQCRLVFFLTGMGLLATGASAAVYTWDGGGADNNWSTAANWEAADIPASASDTTVQLANNVRLAPVQDIAAPFILNRLEYVRFASGSANDTVLSQSGDPLRFVTNGTTQPRLWLNRYADCNLYNDIEIPQGVTLTAEITTWGLNLHGLISGEGGIDKQQQAGAIRLYHANNTFSGGLTIRAANASWYQVQANASGTMGTGPVNLYGGTTATNFTNPGGLILNGTATHTNTIRLFAQSPIHGHGTVTLSGPIELGTNTLHLRGSGNTTVSGVISGSGTQALIKNDTGRWIFAATNTFIGRITINNGYLRFAAPDVLSPGVPLTLTGGTLELNGMNQTLGELTSAPAIVPAYIETSAAAVLTVAQNTDTAFDGRLTGPITLVKTGTGTLALGNSANAFSGVLVISNGTLAVTASGALNSGGELVLAGGKLGLNASTAVRRLYYGDVRQPRGTYGSTVSGAQFKDDERFTGTEVLAVTESVPAAFTSHVWDADAGESETALAVAANWVDDVLPPFGGSALAVFGTAGSTATVAAATSLYGVSFTRETDFSVTGSAALTLGQGGLSAANQTASRTYTVSTPLMLADSQTWDIGSNATVQLSGSIGDVPGLPAVLVKTGAGRVQLNADNTFSGPFTISNGTVRITKAGALGTAAGATAVMGSLGGKILLSGTFTSDEPLTMGGDLNNFGLMELESGNVTLAGPVTMFNQIRIKTSGGKTLTFAGGITGNGNGLLVINPNGGTIAFTNKPVRIPGQTLYFDQSGTCVVAVTNNLWAEALVCAGTLRCDVPNALPPASSLKMGVDRLPSGTIDLNGNDQTVGKIYMGTLLAGQRVVKSDAPATLTVHQNANSALDVRFDGAVSLLKSGTGTLTLTNAFSATSGGFIVTNGTLAVAAAGTFGPNCTNVTVLGNGTLWLDNPNSVAIADTAVVTMPAAGVASAKINLSAGVNERIGWLFYGDKMKRAGTYGAVGSGAQYQDDTHFTGSGILTVSHDQSGTLMFVK
ncbi:MAG TPA: autotransporter-associated beta strand repeat-containing protein [Kiritimatiellia bacterium]|nr:autotransporter-associated beta strand repeat-containing protein [Kiritimatiellia bacterium]